MCVTCASAKSANGRWPALCCRCIHNAAALLRRWLQQIMHICRRLTAVCCLCPERNSLSSGLRQHSKRGWCQSEKRGALRAATAFAAATAMASVQLAVSHLRWSQGLLVCSDMYWHYCWQAVGAKQVHAACLQHSNSRWVKQQIPICQQMCPHRRSYAATFASYSAE